MSWTGGSFGTSATCVLAPNADVMTLDGTNTWVLSSGGRSLVVDLTRLSASMPASFGLIPLRILSTMRNEHRL